jgi:hypothetical protein
MSSGTARRACTVEWWIMGIWRHACLRWQRTNIRERWCRWRRRWGLPRDRNSDSVTTSYEKHNVLIPSWDKDSTIQCQLDRRSLLNTFLWCMLVLLQLSNEALFSCKRNSFKSLYYTSHSKSMKPTEFGRHDYLHDGCNSDNLSTYLRNSANWPKLRYMSMIDNEKNLKLQISIH